MLSNRGSTAPGAVSSRTVQFQAAQGDDGVNPFLAALLGATAGGLLAVIVVLVVNALDPRIFTKEQAEEAFGFPVIATHCRYKSPVRFDDLLTLRTRVVRVEEKGATFGFSLFRTVEGKDLLAAEGKISCRSIDASWKPVPIPKDLRKALTGQEQGRS